ncbi:MAG TPA: methyltransferase domain-containing protein [Gaiellales bacterium]|jgi:SAM-dependent methyltransferase|nr:methyltransferase domain-containing protein [Gaiellales bacterium]
MADLEVVAFARANLPDPPCRVLEVGAGEGELASSLATAGYAITAIDPDPRGDNVDGVALADLDAEAGVFAGAVAIRSLHHVHPLAPSLQRLAEVLEPGAALVIDEMDVAAFDRRSAEWWLEQQAARGKRPEKTAEQLVDEHRAHLHPLDAVLDALSAWFSLGAPVRGPWLYRWDLGPAMRADEEALIASGELPAMGARVVAVRNA